MNMHFVLVVDGLSFWLFIAVQVFLTSAAYLLGNKHGSHHWIGLLHGMKGQQQSMRPPQRMEKP